MIRLIDDSITRIKKYPYLTLFSLGAFCVLIALGLWQLKRLEWKNDLVARINSGLSAPAIPIPPRVDPAADELKKISVSGIYLNNKEIHIAAKYRNGQLGYYILTPLRIPDGRTILINRGWVPEDKIDPKTRPEGIKKNKVKITGLIMRGFPKHWYSPANSPEKNIWLSTDYSQLKTYLKIDIENYLIQELPGRNPKEFPSVIEPNIKLRNDHLQYAITWFAMAASLLVIYFIYMKNNASLPKS